MVAKNGLGNNISEFEVISLTSCVILGKSVSLLILSFLIFNISNMREE